MSVKETAGQLIKSGRFKEAIPMVMLDVMAALHHGVATKDELLGDALGLVAQFQHILLDPSDFEKVQKLGDKFLQLEMRIPGYLRPLSKEEFYKNVKLNYETIKTNNK